MSTGQIVGTITGAAVGFAVGGPTGAVYGAQIGYAAGTALDPPKGPTVEGPRLSDLSVQTSTYGQFIPRTYGTIGLSGNVFWLENNQIKEVVKKKKSGGKGGGSSSTVKTYTYYATFAVGLCEGPIAGVRRIWVGPDLVYDAGSDDLETIISSNNASSKFTIYTGTDIQQPDPRMQAEIGVANCPAYRGLAYIVVKDLKLTNYGNSVAGAQVKVEVVTSSTVNGLRKIVDVASGVTYGGEQYIYNSDGATFVSSGTNGYAHAPTGFASYIGVPDVENRNPGSSGTLGIAGALSNGYYLFGRKTNLTYIDGVDIGFKANDGASPAFGSIIGIPDIEKANKKLLGVTVSSDGNHIIVAFCADSLDINTSISVATFYVLNTDLEVISSGSLNSDISGYYPIAWGRSKAFPIYGVSCLSNDLASLYHLDGAGGNLYRWSITATGLQYEETLVGAAASAGTFQYPAIYEKDGIIYAASGSKFYSFVTTAQIIPQLTPLTEIIDSECARSGLLAPADVDASGLTDSVTGFKVTATGSIRNAIEPLRGAWPFDVVQAGYKIKATSRGSASVVTIPIGELAIDTQLTESREMDSQLPQNVTVKYIDRERDYDSNEQRAQRDNTEAVNSLVLELPVVLSATQSAQVADKLIRIYALEKSDFSFTLPAPYRYLEPGDVVTIAADDADYVLRLASVNQTADGRLECAGRPSSAATYTSIAPGDGGQQGTVTIPLAGATVGLIVDCPVIDEGLQDAPGFAVGMNGYSAGWPGGVLYRTADNGQTWDDLQALDGRATAGYAAGVLAASAGNLIQRGGSLTVSLIGGTLESVTEAQMLNGANICAYGVNGRWEVMRFQNATLNADGTYTLDTFWRGDKGTEWATGLHTANDIFVLMTDPDLAFVGMPTDSIGQPRDYRAVTAGADIDSAANQAFTYSAVNLETLSGVHPRGSRSAGDLTITWQRRTRAGGAWRDYVDASLGEATQAYEVDIMQGVTVKRTLTAVTPSVLYTSAMQVADFGSAQSSVTVNIYQLSAVVGRGYKLEATL